MISHHEIFEVGKLKVEVNWTRSVIPCKKVRFTLAGKTETVHLGELYSLLMLFGDEKIQDAIIPVTKTEMRMIERSLHLRLKKDMKEGDVVNFTYKYLIPDDVFQRLLKESPNEYRAPLSPASVTKKK